MRVSTAQIYGISDIGMRNAQSAVNKTSEQISSGKRVLSPADDPVAATGIMRLNQQLGRIEQYEKNVNAAENNLEQEEVAVDSVLNLLQRMRELTVQAGNTGTYTASDYESMAEEVDSRIGELFSLQNKRNSSGQYIFGGHQGSTQPFVEDGEGNFRYQGDEGQQHIQLSENSSVAVTDSGKKLFVDVPSGHNTFNTRPSSDNRADPPAQISVGDVVDQEAYDEFYPRDMRIQFNAPGSVTPPESNYTIKDDRGRILAENQRYEPGEPIEINGVSVRITGQPDGGEPAAPATLDYGTVGAEDFDGAPQTVTLQVGGQSEELVLDRTINNASDLADALNSTTETTGGSGADRNAERLANLGITADATGLTQADGRNITLSDGSVETDNVFGRATQGDGTTSTDGEPAEPGDSFLVESSNKQDTLSTLSRLSEAMRNADDSPESEKELGEVVSRTLNNLDNSITRLSEVQGELGARFNTLETSRESLADTRLYSEEALAEIEDLDYAEASTRLQMESLVLRAAQQSFAKVSGLSLFNYL